MDNFTDSELESIRKLILENRDSAKLQKASGLGYMDSIKLKGKIDEMIDELNKKAFEKKSKHFYNIEYDSEEQEMIIEDVRNKTTYKIPTSLVDDGKVAAFTIVDVQDEITQLEDILIPEARNLSDKNLMKEDLATLNDCDDEYVFAYYGTNGFITKNNIEEFNKVCSDMVESFIEYSKTQNTEIKLDTISTKAGQTDLLVGDKVVIKLPKNDEDYGDLNGKTGTVTHPFAFGETKKGYVGIYLDENCSYGDKINIHTKNLSVSENLSVEDAKNLVEKHQKKIKVDNNLKP